MRNCVLALTLALFIDITASLVIENAGLLEMSEEQMLRLQPTKKAGAFSAQRVPPNALCVNCLLEARKAIDRFNQFIYLSYFEQTPNVTNSDQLFGVKTCQEFSEVLSCFTNCTGHLTSAERAEADRYFEVKTLNGLNNLLCEARYTPGHASCRLADTHRCSKIRRSQCGDSLVEFTECVEEVLRRSGQNCSGYCSPARRFLRSQEFIWEMECALKATHKSQCKDIVTIFCFEQVKDSDVNYGVYQHMDTMPELADSLANTCQVLKSPFECMDTATNGFYDYFGLNVTYACRGAEETMDSVKADWQTLIDPFCSTEALAIHTTIADVCPTPDPANAPPEIPITPIPTTTTTTVYTGAAYEPKSGRCPITANPLDGCDGVCADDSHCTGTKKCCDSCCKEPLRRVPGRRRFCPIVCQERKRRLKERRDRRKLRRRNREARQQELSPTSVVN